MKPIDKDTVIKIYPDTIRKAGGILLVDRKFMLERHGGNETYIIPGGKLEADETPEEALIRELEEEFHISVSLDDLNKVGIFKSHAVHNPDKKVRIHTFLVSKWTGEIKLDDGIEEVVWVNSKNIKDFKVSSITMNDVLPFLLNEGLID